MTTHSIFPTPVGCGGCRDRTRTALDDLWRRGNLCRHAAVWRRRCASATSSAA